MENKKFYWIKLRTDFFADDSPMDVLLGLPNGSEYVCLYLKLCLMTANKGGRLCTEIGEMLIPYNVEKITQDMKFFSIDTVRVALDLYKKLGLVYEETDGIIKISGIEEMVGMETSSAVRVREWREKKKSEALLQCNHNVTQEIRDKSIDIKSIDTDIDINTITDNNSYSFKSIVEYLNKKLGSRYQVIESTKKLIRARMKEGFTEEDFYTVIDKMYKAWGSDPKMSQYLRPQTLFGTKFESYLNKPDSNDAGSNGIDWSKL